MSVIDIKLDSLSKVYSQGDTVKGHIIVQNKLPLSHLGVNLQVEGTASLTLSSKSVGRIESIYNTTKSVSMLFHSIDVLKAGKFPEGEVQIPFQFKLEANASSKALHETYHGVYITMQYLMKCTIKRGMLNKDMLYEMEFLVEDSRKLSHQQKMSRGSLHFKMSENSLQQNADNTTVATPKFSIKGTLKTTSCSLNDPFTGELTVEKCDVPIRSIDIQLARVETVGSVEGFAKETSEIQNMEIASGDVVRGWTIPIYMLFPRLFTCPTLETTNFKIEFEINVVVVFSNDMAVMENFPIRLNRC